MHIEPGVVQGAKILFSGATASASLMFIASLAQRFLMSTSALQTLLFRSLAASTLVFCFFEALPHFSVGVSEVHFIFGATLFLLFGAAAAAIGLSCGLLLQGLLVSPLDLPQYGMNVTTLIAPLWAVQHLAKRITRKDKPYVQLDYWRVLALSATYQGGVVFWVAFWAFYGQGFSLENFGAVAAFSGAYVSVVLVEPLLELGVLAVLKNAAPARALSLFTKRLFCSQS